MASIPNYGTLSTSLNWMNSLYKAAEKDQTADIIRLFNEIRSGACKMENHALTAAISKATVLASRIGNGAAVLILTHFNPLKENYDPTEEKHPPSKNADAPQIPNEYDAFIAELNKFIDYGDIASTKNWCTTLVISIQTRVQLLEQAIASPFPEPEILAALLQTGPIPKQVQETLLAKLAGPENANMRAALEIATTF